jgi:formamidopyrimidine-DNA glycosylase
MPELPEVEVLVRHLKPLLVGRIIQEIDVRRKRVLRPTSERAFRETLLGATFVDLTRRGKYLLFSLRASDNRSSFLLVGHLGMTGRMYLQPREAALPKHAAVVLGLGERSFVFEDLRYFGRLTLDDGSIRTLGPEPLEDGFTAEGFRRSLARSGQPVKVKLLEQSVVAGVGNIYASEALFRARISPRRPARRLTRVQVDRLRAAIRDVLSSAIEFGASVPLNWSTGAGSDSLFYYGSDDVAGGFYDERLRVYDRENQPCAVCGAGVKRIVQAGRSTYYCPRCQRD